jgi:hypothetical protein
MRYLYEREIGKKVNINNYLRHKCVHDLKSNQDDIEDNYQTLRNLIEVGIYKLYIYVDGKLDKYIDGSFHQITIVFKDNNKVMEKKLLLIISSYNKYMYYDDNMPNFDICVTKGDKLSHKNIDIAILKDFLVQTTNINIWTNIYNDIKYNTEKYIDTCIIFSIFITIPMLFYNQL